MSKTVNGANTGKPVTAQRASASRGTTSVPQGNTRGQSNIPDQGSTLSQSRAPAQPPTAQASSPAQHSTAQASSKTYVGVCVYIDVDGTIKPERIALGNGLFGISSVVDVKDIHNGDGNNQDGNSTKGGGSNGNSTRGNARNTHNTDNALIKDYTVEIWNGKGKTLKSHLFMENSGNRIRWYVMQKAKASASV